LFIKALVARFPNRLRRVCGTLGGVLALLTLAACAHHPRAALPQTPVANALRLCTERPGRLFKKPTDTCDAERAAWWAELRAANVKQANEVVEGAESAKAEHAADIAHEAARDARNQAFQNKQIAFDQATACQYSSPDTGPERCKQENAILQKADDLYDELEDQYYGIKHYHCEAGWVLRSDANCWHFLLPGEKPDYLLCWPAANSNGLLPLLCSKDALPGRK
jgi:hypothetical protein